MCGDCHVRGDRAVIDALDGFEEHNQQFDDLFNSKHFAISCVACHDPHSSAVYEDEELNPNKGIVQACESCHWQNTRGNVRNHLGVDCVDCHMPRMVKSAQGNLDLFRADIHSHQFSINPDPAAPQFNEEGTQAMPYLTLQYVCGQCHNDDYADALDPEVLGSAAAVYHDAPTPVPTETPEPAPEAAEGEAEGETADAEGTPQAEPTATPQS
jgi:hypothetical protein